ncbi:putative Mitochondrial import inner membrane translocase subunit Tim9 [Hypsibius exemplaris]|uniref:Mitochondrial import inner membrane translocase subunit n=1 Tax=Hypsibius exemplaris TaxID=2072580 RepID=A0A1W0WF17_HYPEX|nr:putative Mitochondrial import inner membrane translocase subunit Tim9 [Hypsibius exemplaris]
MWGSKPNAVAPAQEEQQQATIQQSEQVKQLKDFLMSYNKLSELCFDSCVHDFTTRRVLDAEDSCSSNCVEKYLKLNQRVSMRFQEYQSLQNEAALAVAQQAGHYQNK